MLLLYHLIFNLFCNSIHQSDSKMVRLSTRWKDSSFKRLLSWVINDPRCIPPVGVHLSKIVAGKCQPTFSRKYFVVFSMTIRHKHTRVFPNHSNMNEKIVKEYYKSSITRGFYYTFVYISRCWLVQHRR